MLNRLILTPITTQTPASEKIFANEIPKCWAYKWMSISFIRNPVSRPMINMLTGFNILSLIVSFFITYPPENESELN